MKFIPYVIALLFCLSTYNAQSQDDTRLEEPTYTQVEQMPAFPGCESIADPTARKNCAFKTLIQFVSDNMVYPEAAKAAKLEGDVLINFIIDKEGTVTKASVAKGFDPACDAEALRVVNEMPKWNPGVQHGENVAVHMTLPIRFSL